MGLALDGEGGETFKVRKCVLNERIIVKLSRDHFANRETEGDYEEISFDPP